MSKRLLLLAAAACFLSGSSAWASLIVSVQPLGVTGAAGSSGNSFDVLLTNTGGSAVNIGGFSFGLTTANTNVVFNAATISTTLAPYVFGGNSLFGPEIDTTSGAQEIVASDYDSNDPIGATVGAGSTVGLGHITFSVAAMANIGTFDLTLESYPTTSLSNGAGSNVVINVMTNGNGVITVGLPGAPEPSTFLLMLGGLVFVAILVGRRKIRLHA